MANRDTIQPIENLDPDDFIDALFDPNDPAVANDPLLQVIKHLYETINTLITHTNTNNTTVDKVKDNLTSDINLDTLVSNVSTNNAKTGITSTQAGHITANNAKTGITSTQAGHITANNSKTGITTSQAAAIVLNTAKAGVSSSQASEIKASTAALGQFNNGNFTRVLSEDGKLLFNVQMVIAVNSKTGAPASLKFQVTTSKGAKFEGAVTLAALK